MDRIWASSLFALPIVLALLSTGCPQSGPAVTAAPQTRGGLKTTGLQVFTVHVTRDSKFTTGASIHKALVDWIAKHPDLEIQHIVTDGGHHSVSSLIIVAQVPEVKGPPKIEKE